MGRRTRRKFSAEYKAEVVELCRTSGRSIGAIAKEMDLTETSLREWVRQAEVDAGRGTGARPGEPAGLAAEALVRVRRAQAPAMRRGQVENGGTALPSVGNAPLQDARLIAHRANPAFRAVALGRPLSLRSGAYPSRSGDRGFSRLGCVSH
jgi:transposase-like protein